MIDDMLASNHSVHNRIVTVIVLLVLQSLLVNMFAQRVITLRSFETSPEITAMQKQYERLDFNQRRCALIRIYLPVDNCSFEGSIVGETSYSRGEYWVYVVENTKRLTIYCPTMEPSNIVWQPEIGNNGVVGGQTYIMKLNGYEMAMSSGDSNQPATPTPSTPATVAQVSHNADETSDETIYEVVEEMPEFPGGMAAMMKFIAQNVRYPEAALNNGIQGRVIVALVVNKDGSIVDAQILCSVDPYLDKEALRVVNSMPNWKPGKQRGKTVRVRYTIPISFKL